MSNEEKASSKLNPFAWIRRRVGKRTVIVVAVLLGILGLGAAGVAYATYDYSNSYEGQFLPGTSVAGIDIAGMKPDQALAAIQEEIAPQLDREITITYKGRDWTTTPRELGARGDAERVLVAALAASEETSFMDKVGLRFLDEEVDFDRDVAITYPGRGARDLVKKIAGKIDVDPVDASLDYSTGWVEVTDSKTGVKVDVDKSFKKLRRALRGGGDEVGLAYKTLQPEVTGDAYEQVLLVRHNERKLYLYEDGEITDSWTVAVGQPNFPTPTGVYSVTELRYMPTWINPAPDGWGADMPAEIAPGPNNPLGLRAINWSAPAIRFHGTENLASLGTAASHGCVRMSNDDVIDLYDRIEVGASIVSTTLG
jgi:L,D-transpeptidase catalytic domain/Putative peptidoglycan binding domain